MNYKEDERHAGGVKNSRCHFRHYVDTLRPLPRSKSRNVCLHLPVGDYYTRSMKVYLFPSQAQGCKMFQVHKTRTSSYQPQLNGLIEQFKHTLLSMLATATKTILMTEMIIYSPFVYRL